VRGLQKTKWEDGTMSKMSKRTNPGRRQFVKGAAALGGLSVYGLPWGAWAQGVANEFDGSKFQLAAPEPNPKSGGVLRYGITMRPPHFDFHQSGTINSLGSQGCMFDNLVRRDPRDSGKTIIPDLAHSWEIAKDGKTYTFHLRKGVQFHDGAELTSEDVKATFDRIALPPVIPANPVINVVLTAANLNPAQAEIATFAEAVDALLSGNTYFQVHTTTNPGGEIRGQILPVR
jgi:ABC-type transport system substrate-binding protein